MQWSNHIQSSSKFPLFLWVCRTFSKVYIEESVMFYFSSKSDFTFNPGLSQILSKVSLSRNM